MHVKLFNICLNMHWKNTQWRLNDIFIHNFFKVNPSTLCHKSRLILQVFYFFISNSPKTTYISMALQCWLFHRFCLNSSLPTFCQLFINDGITPIFLKQQRNTAVAWTNYFYFLTFSPKLNPRLWLTFFFLKLPNTCLLSDQNNLSGHGNYHQ